MRVSTFQSATLASLLAVCVWAPCRANAQTHIGLHVHLGQHDGSPVVDEAWLAQQVAEANTIFADQEIQFSIRARSVLPESQSELESRRDRHRLGARLEGALVNLFVVQSLRDVDEPERFRQGVHWHARGPYGPEGAPLPAGAHFVVVSSIAARRVLAHELGHFFGNPRHSPVPGNIMSYESADVPPRFDAVQSRRIRRALRRYLESRELREFSSEPAR